MDQLFLTAVVSALVALLCVGRSQEVSNLRQDTTVDAGHYGEIKTAIYTNKTKAYLSCESGDMVVTVDFVDPFFGVIYANRDPSSPCRVYGDGGRVYVIRLPLQGCGTKEDPKRTFINDIVVRFRQGLIIDEDEVKTIICRYGPPVAPPIVPPIIPPLPAEPPGIVAKPKRLTEAEIYVIVCFLLFLALLLLGVGLAYYCLKRRNIKIIRKRRAISSSPASEITKLSGSTLGTLTQFDGFRIPRATAHSTSGSEAALLTAGSGGDQSDTIPSDYPSESPSSMHSDVEEVETRSRTLISETSTVRDDHYRYENRAFRPEEIPPPETMQLREEIRTMSEMSEEYSRTSYTRRGYPPPPPPLPPPLVTGSIPDNDHRSMSEFEEPTPIIRPTLYTATTTDYRSLSERLQDFSRQEPPKYLPTYVEESRSTRSLSEVLEPPAVYTAPPPPVKAQPRRHTIDDRYVTTLTETHTQEDIERLMRETTHTHMKETVLPQQRWDVVIRTYPPVDLDRPSSDIMDNGSESDDWDKSSYVSERPRSLLDPTEEPVLANDPPNWDVLFRVLQPRTPSLPPDEPESVEDLTEDDREKWKRIIMTDSTFVSKVTEARTVEELHSIRTDQRYQRLFEPRKWDVIIRMLAAPPDVDRANSDVSSTTSDPPHRIRYRKKSDFDTRSRRSSLPPVYEYEADSEYNQASEDLDQYDVTVRHPRDIGSTRSRRTDHSSVRSAFDLRSMTEEDVNFAKHKSDNESVWSVDSGPSYLRHGEPGTARSIAERSTSEIVEDIAGYYQTQRSQQRMQAEQHYQESSSSAYPLENGRTGDRYLDRSSSEIIMDSPVLRAMGANGHPPNRWLP